MRREIRDVYSCMFCKKQFSTYPETGICDICGMPINSEKCRYLVNASNQFCITIKIGDEQALNNMRNGEFWFQSPKYYQSFVENDAVGDVNECAFDYIYNISEKDIEKYMHIIPGEKIILEGKEWILDKIMNGKFCVHSVYQNNYRLLCFYQLHMDEKRHFIKPDERMRLFGTHFSIVKDRDKFEKIVGKYVESVNYDLFFLPTSIAYLYDTYRGVYTPGCKFKKYEYQNEYRFILGSSQYGKLPEMEKKVIHLPEVKKEDILTEPIPLDFLWSTSSLDDIVDLMNLQEQ